MFGRILVKGTMLTVNIGFAVLLLITMLASYISPQTFVLPAFATLLYPFTILVNVLFIVFWVVARKWYFLLSLIILLLASEQLSTVLPVHFGKTETKELKPTIRIMTYNTMLFGHLQKHTAEEKNSIIDHILKVNPDIVCLQEFAVSTKTKTEYLTLKDIERAFKSYPYKHIELNQQQSWKRSGIATFSKFPIVKEQNISDADLYGVSIYSDVKINKDTIRIFNNHLESNRLTERDRNVPLNLKQEYESENLSGSTKKISRKLYTAYKARALQAEKVADEIKQSPHKVILCGDFNDVPASYTYAKMKGNLSDAYAETGNGIGWTMNLTLFLFRIDYLMYDANAIALQDFYLDKVKYSDHYPIYMDFSIKKQ